MNPAAHPSPAAGPGKPVIGWREWVQLPELGARWIKAKIDTGARSSVLHAFDLEIFERHGRKMVRFEIHPLQRSTKKAVRAEAEVVDERWVTSSNGKRDLRPVIVTSIGLLDQTWSIELTLARRDLMGFRMLLGRQAIRKRFLVNPGVSYRGERKPRTGAAKKPRSKKS